MFSNSGSFPIAIEDRKAKQQLLPEDVSKKELGEFFLKYFRMHGKDSALKALIVCDEPHKKFMPGGERRARHKHAVIHMTSGFAHRKIQDWLAGKGITGFFSFNLSLGFMRNGFCVCGLCVAPARYSCLLRNGFSAYCKYLFEPSHKKLPSDIDQDPWLWPASLTFQKVKTTMQNMPRDQQSKNGLANEDSRKRKTLTFSEVTDMVVENQVRSEPQLWALAKKKKMEGDDTLWNRLGDEKCVVTLLKKIIGAWYATSAGRTLKTCCPYPLTSFRVPPAVQEWISESHKSKALILSGLGEIGKTAMASAALVAVAGHFHFISGRDQIKGLVFLNQEGLLWDEACFSDLSVDLCKALIDLEHDRNIHCRNTDGMIPAGTPRIFATNHKWESFWPFVSEEHRHAIKRRVTWVDLTYDLRVSQESEDCDEEDPFGHGGQLH